MLVALVAFGLFPAVVVASYLSLGIGLVLRRIVR